MESHFTESGHYDEYEKEPVSRIVAMGGNPKVGQRFLFGNVWINIKYVTAE